jgi:uncharacterized protein (DUF1501 family)
VSQKLGRRLFLKSSGLAMIGLGFAPGFLRRAPAAIPGGNKKVLVVIFQRGGADGLSMVPPVGDPRYYELRPALALKPPGRGDGSAVRLDETFGLHPALGKLKPFFEAGSLAIIPAAGSPNSTRSHFDAQDFMESGTPGILAQDGWLNRALQRSPRTDATAFRALALQPNLPRSLIGPAPAVAMSSVAEFRVQAKPLSKSFESLYLGATDSALRTSGKEAFEAMRVLESAKLEEIAPQNGVEYPRSPLGKRLQDIARLIRADLGVQIAATDVGGWDTHVAQGNAEGQLANRLAEFANAIAAFAGDLGEKMSEVCLVTMTEFGRTVRENGNRGTDHGTASVMMVLGGTVRGGKVLGSWRELAEANLYEGRDLAVGTDYRDVLSEVLSGFLGLPASAKVFPDFQSKKVGLFS